MPRLVANAALRYASRDLEAGEEFEASASDAFVLTKTGKAAPKADKNEAPETEGAAVDHAAAAENSAELFGEQGRQRNRYNRRDMRAKN
jgi:hypothetical protein